MIKPAAVVLSLLLLAAPVPERLNRLISQMQADRPVFGIWCSDFSLRNAAVLADSQLDYIIIDMEHNPLDFSALAQFMQGMLSRRQAHESLSPRVVPIVRLPQNGRERAQFHIKQALDAGAYGLMLPHINTSEEALAAVQAVRYPQKKGAADFHPRGQRGVAPDPAARYWGLPVAEYVARADVWPLDPQGEIFLILQIESLEGIENLDSILAVPGVSAIFLGPSDLSFSLGYPDDPSAPALESALQKGLQACRKAGIPVGITTDLSSVEQRLQQGFRVVTVGEDPGVGADAAATLRRGREFHP